MRLRHDRQSDVELSGMLPRMPWLALLLLTATFPQFLRAQGLGTIGGDVTDPSGAVVPGAKVTVIQQNTGVSRAVTSDTRGHYVIPLLRPAVYTLTVEAQGFRRFMRTGILLEADETAAVNVQLALGTASESVAVEGSAQQVDTYTQTIRDVVEQARMVELPLNGRSAAELINLVAGARGASPTVLTSPSSLPGSIHPSINGSRDNQTNYLLDGANYSDEYYNTNIPFPFPDALEEFSVQTSNYSAQYGGNAGGVVNVVTKSGANQLHGDLFEFNRNAAFNAPPIATSSSVTSSVAR